MDHFYLHHQGNGYSQLHIMYGPIPDGVTSTHIYHMHTHMLFLAYCFGCLLSFTLFCFILYNLYVHIHYMSCVPLASFAASPSPLITVGNTHTQYTVIHMNNTRNAISVCLHDTCMYMFFSTLAQTE